MSIHQVLDGSGCPRQGNAILNGISEMFWDPWTADFYGTLEAVATVVALALGGVWTYRLFVKKRTDQVKVRLQHDISSAELPGEKQLLQVRVGIENVSEALLSIERVETWVQQILPLHPDLTKEVGAHDPLAPRDPHKIPWPMVADREVTWPKGKFEIEPGEDDEILFDFIIDHPLEVVRVYTFIDNIVKGRLGWSRTTRFGFRRVSGQHFDEVTRLDEEEIVSEDKTTKKTPKEKRQQEQEDRPPATRSS